MMGSCRVGRRAGSIDPSLPGVLQIERRFDYTWAVMGIAPRPRAMRFPTDGRGVIAEAQTSAVRRWAYVARLYPTAGQAASLDAQGRAARVLWNLVHDWYTWGGSYHSIARRPPIAEMDRQIREARVKPLLGWEWLARLPAQSSQQVLKDYVRAWHRFHRGLARPPKFKKPGRRMAVDVPQASALNITRLNYRWGELSIPLVGRFDSAGLVPCPVSPATAQAGSPALG